MKIKKTYLASLLVITVLGLLLFIVPSAYAATFTVDSVADASDVNPGNGVCATAGAVCTLRAAIQESNALDGDDTINFGIAGAGPHEINPASAMPIISEAVDINGTTQAGTTCGALIPDALPSTANSEHTLMVYIDGSLSLSTAAFDIEPDTSEVGVDACSVDNQEVIAWN